MATMFMKQSLCVRADRDVSIHAASAEAKHVDGVVDLLSDVVLRPLFTEDEVGVTDP